PHLLKVIVVSSPPKVETPQDFDDLLRRYAVAGATYFDELVTDAGDRPLRCAISGGETGKAMVLAISERPRHNGFPCPTALGAGRLLQSSSSLPPLVNCALLWLRCGSIPDQCDMTTVTPTPPPRTPAARARALRKLADVPDVQRTLEAMAKPDVAF